MLPGNMSNQPNYGQMPENEYQMSPRALYPEIYYMTLPYINMVCDQMEEYGDEMPSQEFVEQISDGICDDMCRKNPDMAEYVRKFDNMNQALPEELEKTVQGPFTFYGYDRFRRRPRRRGLFRDLVDILFLNELFRRRRRRFDRFDRFY